MNKKLTIPLDRTTASIMSNVDAWLKAENLSRHELVNRLNAFAEENGGEAIWSDTKMTRLFADTGALKDSQIVSLSVVTGIPISDLVPVVVEDEPEAEQEEESEAAPYCKAALQDIQRLIAKLNYYTHEMATFSASNPADLEIEVYEKLRDYVRLLDLYVEDQTFWPNPPIGYMEEL